MKIIDDTTLCDLVADLRDCTSVAISGAGGGLLDQTFLGMAEMDGARSVNVSHFGGQVSGPGVFIDIIQGAHRVIFCGSFDAKGGRCSMEDGAMRIDRHGDIANMVPRVEGVTFSGPEAICRNRRVGYVTERAVCAKGREQVFMVPPPGRVVMAPTHGSTAP